MLNSVLESRISRDGLTQIVLEMPEKEYFQMYDQLNDEIARDLLQQYLLYHNDDGRMGSVKIRYDKSDHIVRISSFLQYLGNEKTTNMYEVADYVHGSDKG